MGARRRCTAHPVRANIGGVAVAAVPIRAITSGPGRHWFGYYDKLQFDPTGRYLLGMRVDFEGRQPRPDDSIAVGVIDLEAGDAWREVGRTRAWCWQQGCMLQWIPGSDRRIIWNDRQGDRFVSRILDLESGASRTLPAAIYAVAPDGRTAIGTDFRRLNDMRPGYGYAGIPDPNREVLAPEDTGIYTLDLTENGAEPDLVITVAEVAALPYPHGDMGTTKHYFNHLLFNTNGSRFIFLHRWRWGEGRRTRMLTAARDGSGLHVVDDYGRMSHFIWRDRETILGWSWRPNAGGAYYLHRDRSDEVSVIGSGTMTRDGHCTFLGGDPDWILNDCYPQGGGRMQELYLYHVPHGRRIDLGSFHAPAQYTGELRCDLHPRSDPGGRYVTIDSAHEGGRQIYLLDISEVVNRHSGPLD